MNIIVSKKAQNDLNNILEYIAEAGYPETANKYLERLMDFINSLVLYKEKYQLCRNKIFSEAGFRCAVFENTYVLIYKIEQKTFKLIRVIHGKNLKE